MLTESLSAQWANWATFAKNIGLVSLVAFIVKRHLSRQARKRELYHKIKVKYSEIVETVRQAGIEADNVTPENFDAPVIFNPLKRVHARLQKCLHQILSDSDDVNQDLNDVSLDEVKDLFSEDAVCYIKHLKGLFEQLDRELYEDYNSINAATVSLLASQILSEWDKLAKDIEDNLNFKQRFWLKIRRAVKKPFTERRKPSC